MNALDIVEVIGRYVQLRQKGANFIGLCPFHRERTASFTVSPAKQVYHCFGCHAHGTAQDFLIRRSALTAAQALDELEQSGDEGMP
jgi:DNA primase